MTALRSRNRALLGKIEAQEGVAETLSPAADAMRVENPRITYDVRTEQTNEATGSLDNSAPIPGGALAQLSFAINMRGSGIVGVAPDFGEVMQMCGWAETLQAAKIPVGAASNAVAGTASSFDIDTAVDTDWSQINQAYQGLPVELTTNPAAAAIALIHDYRLAGNIATASLVNVFGPVLDNTTDAQLLENVLYAPVTNGIPSGTFELYEDGRLTRLVGCRGNIDFALTSGGVWKGNVTMTGLLESRSDAAVPAITIDTVSPPTWRGGEMLIEGVAAAVASMNLTPGGALTNTENPNTAEGFDVGVFTARNMAGTINPLTSLIATRDTLQDARDGTDRVLHARCGGVAGNRLALTVPRARFQNDTDTDNEGVERSDAPFFAAGQDAGAFFTIF